MSTRSRIGIEGEDGQVLSVYCHYDGDPSYNGVQLLDHFNSAEKAYALIQEGDLSSIDGPAMAPEGAYSGGTVSYRRWRNEQDVAPRSDASRRAYRRDSDWDIAYFYLYGPRGWEFADGIDTRWRKLTPKACRA